MTFEQRANWIVTKIGELTGWSRDVILTGLVGGAVFAGLHIFFVGGLPSFGLILLIVITALVTNWTWQYNRRDNA